MTMTNDEAGRIVGRWINKENIRKGRALPSDDEWETIHQNRAAALSTLPACAGNGWAIQTKSTEGRNQ